MTTPTISNEERAAIRALKSESIDEFGMREVRQYSGLKAIDLLDALEGAEANAAKVEALYEQMATRAAEAEEELSECRLFIKGVCDAAEEAHWGVQDNQEYDPEQRGRDMVRIPLSHVVEAAEARAERAEAERSEIENWGSRLVYCLTDGKMSKLYDVEVIEGEVNNSWNERIREEVAEAEARAEKAERERNALRASLATLEAKVQRLEAVARDVQRLHRCWPNPGPEQRDAVIYLAESMRRAGFEPLQAAGDGGGVMYQAQITYTNDGWEECHVLGSFRNEGEAFAQAENYVKATNASGAEIWVLAPGSNFWKVRDRQGRIVQRPVTREA